MSSIASALVLVVLLASCRRSQPYAGCVENSQCEVPTTCVAGVCRDVEAEAYARKCKAAPECAREGLCGSRRVSSTRPFAYACVPKSDYDCSESTACKVEGRCWMGSGPAPSGVACGGRGDASGY